MTQFTDDRLAEQRDAQTKQSTEVFYRWLGKHLEIPNTEATLKAFKRYTDFSDPLVESDFEFAWGNMKGSAKFDVTTRRVPPPSEVHAQLVEDICDLLRNPDPSGKGGRYSQFNIESVRAKMQSWTVAQLQARKDEIIRMQALNERPVSELKQMVRDAQQPQFEFPRLPRTFMEGMKLVPIDALFLRRLPTWELKKYVRIYGERAVNVRLVGE